MQSGIRNAFMKYINNERKKKRGKPWLQWWLAFLVQVGWRTKTTALQLDKLLHDLTEAELSLKPDFLLPAWQAL